MDNHGEILIYQSEDGLTNIEVKFNDEKELDESSTCQNFRQVRKDGNYKVTRELPYYNLDLIISLGYRVKSAIATNFRRWATSHLKEYMIKGFTIDDERLKRNGGDYWKELLNNLSGQNN